mgnify:CR=1 FL=1
MARPAVWAELHQGLTDIVGKVGTNSTWDLRGIERLDHTGAQLLWNTWGRQWPADLLASWAFEMEGIILGWFVLVATGSVLALAVFGSLQFLGTLISPLFGLMGDRIGYRNLLCLMRATYVVDPHNVVQHVYVTNLNVGRAPADTLRVLDALQTDELCPCNRAVGGDVLKAA